MLISRCMVRGPTITRSTIYTAWAFLPSRAFIFASDAAMAVPMSSNPRRPLHMENSPAIQSRLVPGLKNRSPATKL